MPGEKLFKSVFSIIDFIPYQRMIVFLFCFVFFFFELKLSFTLKCFILLFFVVFHC